MNKLPVALATLWLSLAAIPGIAEEKAAATEAVAAPTAALAVSAVSDTASHAADRKELKAMLAGVEAGLNSRDIAAVKKYLHPEAVVTFQDAKVAKGLDALEGYYNEKYGGASAVLKSFSTEAAVDAPAMFVGDVAVAYGHSNDKFVFAGGREFNLESRWTATLRKDEGRWSVMALHFSADLFDNPILKLATSKLMIVGVVALLVGLISGAGVMFLFTRKSR